MVATDIEEAAQDVVVASDDKNHFARYFRRDELPWIANLIGATGELPRLRKNGELFQFKNSRICIPGGRRSGCFR